MAVSCDVLLDPDTGHTGQTLLRACVSGVLSLVEASVLALEFTWPPELVGCISVSHRLLADAVTAGPGCQSCPETCALVLLLQGVPADWECTAQCTQTVPLMISAFQLLKEYHEVEWLSKAFDILPALIHRRRGDCAAHRKMELDTLRLPHSTPPASMFGNRSGGKLPTHARDALLIAATPNMLTMYQPFVNLWRCYALRHGLAFLLETDADVLPHGLPPNWMRWFAARKHLEHWRSLTIVEPDQFVVPECWPLSLRDVLAGTPPFHALRPEPDVATRDFGRPQTLNNGVVFLRNTARGFYFLSELMKKADWMQTIEYDQGAFDETILEFMGMEARDRGAAGYDSECVGFLFPNANGNHEAASYAECWWRQAEASSGPFGARHSRSLRLVDPRITDVNHVVGARGVQEPALLHHFAGRAKDWSAMLAMFGLPRRQTADCRKVLQHAADAEATRACVAGAPVAECDPPTLVC